MTAERSTGAAGGGIATSTLAEIYASQGLHERAIAVYEKLAGRSPADERIRERIAELRAALEAASESAGSEPLADGDETRSSVETETAAVPVPADDPKAGDSLRGASGTDDEQFIAWLKRRA